MVTVWRSSVVATHDFLSVDDIDQIEQHLVSDYFPAVTLTVAVIADQVVGFSGLAGDRLEMLFIDASARGAGVGSALLTAAITEQPRLYLDVNEQNQQALGFYLRAGFQVIGRSATDSDGRPFPLLHLVRERPLPPVIVVMGVAGAGKSSVAGRLADTLAWSFQEGDDLHPPANLAAMAAGHPLTDADREPWLGRIRQWIEAQQAAGRPGIVTCSALKRQYREQLSGPGVSFVQLDLDEAGLRERLTRRVGHFMPAALLDSQLAIWEPLGSEEAGITVNADADLPLIVAEIIQRLDLPQAPADRPRQA